MNASGQLMSKANCGPYRQLSEQEIHTHTQAVAGKSHWLLGKNSGIMHTYHNIGSNFSKSLPFLDNAPRSFIVSRLQNR